VDACADAGEYKHCPETKSPLTFPPGSNVIVAGTAIFNASDPEGVIHQLKTTVNNAQAKIASK
jgi:pentose-5-phosphate-3-epimerase